MMDDGPDAARAPFMIEESNTARARRFPRLLMGQASTLCPTLLLGILIGALFTVLIDRRTQASGPADSSTPSPPVAAVQRSDDELRKSLDKLITKLRRFDQQPASSAATRNFSSTASTSTTSTSTTSTSTTSTSRGAINLDEAHNWEELPGMDKVIHKAQSLRTEHPVRNLQDLFYDPPWKPEELPYLRTECVIDTVQAAAYLGQAVVFLYKAIDYEDPECPPNNRPVGCIAGVAGFITSMSWIASYLSFAANACGQAVNNGALCAGDFTRLMANFGEIAIVGAATRADCNFGKNALQILTRTETISPPWKEFVPAGASPAVDLALKIKGPPSDDIVQCAVDVTKSASYIVRVILQIRAAGSACADPKSCAVGIMNIISSFAWISQFTISYLAVSDCQDLAVEGGADQKALFLCTADISNMAAALTNGPAAGIASTSDCLADL